MSNADFDRLISLAEDKETKNILELIRQDHCDVREDKKIIKGEDVLKLSLFGYTFHMTRKCANSSIDILSDIFLDDRHQKIAGFSGKDSSIVVDVGANEGYYTMRMKKNNPDLKIYAFEPNPHAFKILDLNIEKNGLEGVTTHNLALSDMNEDESFQLVDEITAIGGFRIFGYRPWLDVSRIKEIMVKSATMDETLGDIDHIDILKMDVEGAECRVLKGAEELLPKVDKIVLEYHGSEMKEKVKKYLGKRGYTLAFDDEKEHGDYYFVR